MLQKGMSITFSGKENGATLLTKLRIGLSNSFEIFIYSPTATYFFAENGGFPFLIMTTHLRIIVNRNQVLLCQVQKRYVHKKVCEARITEPYRN
jgi:hypothetical protein